MKENKGEDPKGSGGDGKTEADGQIEDKVARLSRLGQVNKRLDHKQ